MILDIVSYLKSSKFCCLSFLSAQELRERFEWTIFYRDRVDCLSTLERRSRFIYDEKRWKKRLGEK